MSARPKVAIIGTAGRQDGALTSSTFDVMVNDALATIRTTFGLNPSDCELISGGAAWADHVAVQLFLQGQGAALTIYSPCEFRLGRFADNGNSDWRHNPGNAANYYHRLFTRKVERDTLAEIVTAATRGAIINTEHHGFHARNDAVAKGATHMIAFSRSATGAPTDGGTAYTWNKCPLPAALKIHHTIH